MITRMEEGKNMNTYFYMNEEKDESTFFKIPKALMKKELSNNAKLLYGILLDRNSLSIKNEWKDEKDRIYIYYSISNIMESLRCSKATAISVLKELENIDLVEKVRRGLGKVSKLYVKKIQDSTSKSVKEEAPSKNNKTKKVVFFYLSKSKKYTLRSKDIKPTEVKKLPPYNKTERSKTDGDFLSIHQDDVERYEKILKENIEYDVLKERFGKKLDEYVSIMLDVMMSDRKKIAGVNIQLLKNQFMKLNAEHMQYAIWSMEATKTQIKDIYAYIVKTLYHAPMTHRSYITALFNYHQNAHECEYVC